MSIYNSKEYQSRDDYLEYLAEEYDVSAERVRMIADLLGPEEDFDGLVTTLEDMSMERE